MAAFVAKQLVGNKIGAVKGQLGNVAGGNKEEEETEEDAEARAEQEELRREEEAKRTEKYRKMEEERETMRQGIRDKYGIKKKETLDPMAQPADPGRIGRKKKTPAELAAEAEKEEDEPIVIGSVNVSELTNKVSDIPGQMAAKVGDKCAVQ